MLLWQLAMTAALPVSHCQRPTKLVATLALFRFRSMLERYRS